MGTRNASIAPAAPAAGFTMIEVIVSTLILSAIVLVTAMALQGGNNLLVSTSVETEAEIKAGRIADQIANLLRMGMFSTLKQVDDTAFPDSTGIVDPTTYELDPVEVTNGVKCRKYDRYKGAAVAGESFRVLVGKGEDDDDVDNDGDNYVDEKIITLQTWPADFTPTPTTSTIIGENVEALSLARYGRRIQVRVTVFRYDPSSQQVRTFEGRAEATIKD